MRLPNAIYNTKLYKFWRSWYQFWWFVRAYERRDELERLIDWAERKRLSGVRWAYHNRLMDEEGRINSQGIRHMTLARRAWWLYRLNKFVFGEPQYYPKGYAAKYRLNFC